MYEVDCQRQEFTKENHGDSTTPGTVINGVYNECRLPVMNRVCM